MKSLDADDGMFLIGTFNKVLFPALRLGYVVVPDAWMDRVLALRDQSDRYPPGLPQAILARFIEEGHFGRHLRRMRELYGRRRLALGDDVRRYLGGVLEVPEIEAGLTAATFLRRHGVPVRVYEAGKQIAGLARSERDPDGFTYDFGAHFITNRLAAAVGCSAICRDMPRYGETVWLRGRGYSFGDPPG